MFTDKEWETRVAAKVTGGQGCQLDRSGTLILYRTNKRHHGFEP